ncbi:MAG: tetratricopeptide repeat protein [Acidobacteriaceae bacterium]
MRFKAIPLLALAVLLLRPATVAAQDHTENFSAVTVSASSAREQGDIPRAIALYQEAVQLNPQWPDGWWYLGTLQYGTNAYAPAIDALTRYIDLTPKAGPALALRGLCEFEEAQYPQALQDLERGIALGAANQPRNSQIILYHEALLLTKLGRFEEALGKYAAMVKHGVLDEDITNGIGLAGLRLPILPKEIDPDQAQLVATVGTAAASVMRGDLAGGHQEFQAIFKDHPAMPYLHYLYGYLLSVVAPEQAITQFQKELAISPSSAIAHSMLAWCLGAQKDFKAALPNAQKSVQEDPSLLMGQLVLGRDLVDTGDSKGSLPHLEAVLKADPKNLEAHLALAKAYSELGRKDDARRERLLCLALSNHGAAANANL